MPSNKRASKKNNKFFGDKKRVPSTPSQSSPDQAQNFDGKEWQNILAQENEKSSDTNQSVFSPEVPTSLLPDKNTVSTWRYKDFLALVKAFVNDSEEEELPFPPSLSAIQRSDVHRIADIFKLKHKSHGTSTNRALKLTKPRSKRFPQQGEEFAFDGVDIAEFDGFQGAQELENCPAENQLQTAINLMNKYWHNMCHSLRAEPRLLQGKRKQMGMSKVGLPAEPSHKRDDLRYQTLQKQRQALPTFARRNDIINALTENDIIIVCGATGCGKTTQVPQIIYDAHIFPKDSIIVCTQPRRISALSVAGRVAEERGESCGDSCGYVIRFENQTSPSTRIIYETTGILLRHLHTEPDLDGVSCVIVDEVHERDVETDFCLLLLRDRLIAQNRYPNRYRFKLKLVVMSATVQIESLVNYFSGANIKPQVPLISIEGTLFPVDEYFLEDAIQWVGVPASSVPAMGLLHRNTNPQMDNEGDKAKEHALYDKLRSSVFDNVERDAEAMVPYELICKLILYIHGNERNRSGSILVFLPGWAAITRVHNMLKRLQEYRELFVLLLHSSLTSSEQQRVFLPAPKRYRKVVLATSIAETSITIDDVFYVLDSGLVKGTHYDPSCNLSSLTATLISKANGKQRRGRAGRCQAGVCVHLLPAAVYDGLQDFLLPEMMRSPLEEVCLQLKAIHPKEKCESVLMRAMDPPPVVSVRNAVQFLMEMGAFTNSEQLTNLGYALAQLPLHPLLGKMLFSAACLGVLDSVATIAAGLSVKSLFIKPHASERAAARENMQKMDENKLSDHFCVIKLHREWLKSGRSHHYAVEHFADQSALRTLDRTKQQLIQLVLRSPLLRRLRNPVLDASCHDSNTGLVRLVVLWSLFPRVASIEFRGKRANKNFNLICWDNKSSTFTMNSILAYAKRKDFESRSYVMYYERMQLESSLTLFDSSCVSPLDLALCVNQLTICPLSKVPDFMLVDNTSKMVPASPLNLGILDNKEDYMAVFFDKGKKFYVTTKTVARALKMARSCMDYYLALSIKKLRADIFPQDLLRAIAIVIGYPLSDIARQIGSFSGAPSTAPAHVDVDRRATPSFIRGHEPLESSNSEADDNMVVVESDDEFDQPLALTADQKEYVATTFGNLTVLRDDETSTFFASAQGGNLPNEDKPVADTEVNTKGSNKQDYSTEQEDKDDDEDVIVAKPGELVII